MSDEAQQNPDGSAAAGAGYGQISPAQADRRVKEQQDIVDEHPELLAAGAFVGGFLAAQLLKRVSGE